MPKVVGDLHDVLTLPGLDRYSLMQMQTELILNPDVRLGADFVGFYLYNLTKNNILLDEAWKKIDTQIALNKVDLKIL